MTAREVETMQFLDTDTTIQIPENIAVCPYFDTKLTVRVESSLLEDSVTCV